MGILITAETIEAHRAKWFVWAGGVKMPRTAKMRGTWGYDVTCSCGWESRTGGATRTSVENALWDHRFSAQTEATVMNEFACRLCGADAGAPCRDGNGTLDHLHAERYEDSLRADS
jgi:hypothetical protein